MANRINPWPAGAQAVNDLTVTTIENVSKAAAASTALLLRVAGTGTVASALAVRAFLDAIPVPQPVRRDAGPAPAEPATPVDRAPVEQARDGIEAPRVIEPHDSEQVAHATAEVAAAAVAAAERAEEQAAEQGEVLAEQAEQVAAELEQAAEDVSVEDESAEDDSAEVGAPPIENWDQLTLASARARMRRLSLDDLHRLLAYERSHAERGSIVTMLENRIAKVEAGGA